MKNNDNDRRRHPRYDTEMEVYFKIKYDVKIRVEFQVIDDHHEGGSAPKHFGLCNNVSAEGMLIVSKKQVNAGDILMIEVYEPIMKKPINMEGRVRWCEKSPGVNKEHDMFYVGVQISSVAGVPAADSIYFDKNYAVVWSALLESLFGTFSALKKYAIWREHKDPPK